MPEMPTSGRGQVTAQDGLGHSPSLRRWVPFLILLTLTALTFAAGWHKHLSFRTIGMNYEILRGYIDGNLVLSLLVYILGYVAVAALSLPGAAVMTVFGGLLFGWKLAVPATIVGATIGATIIFLVARSSIGEALADKTSPWLSKLRHGFEENAFSYLLFLRLVPAFPFVIVNLAAAVLRVPLRTYVFATALGIIPCSFALSFAGSGLGSVVTAQNAAHEACLTKAPPNPEIACPYVIDTGVILTKELLIALVLLAVFGLIPIVVKKWSRLYGTAS